MATMFGQGSSWVSASIRQIVWWVGIWEVVLRVLGPLSKSVLVVEPATVAQPKHLPNISANQQTKQANKHASKQASKRRSNEATMQRRHEATKQRSDETTKQRSKSAKLRGHHPALPLRPAIRRGLDRGCGLRHGIPLLQKRQARLFRGFPPKLVVSNCEAESDVFFMYPDLCQDGVVKRAHPCC